MSHESPLLSATDDVLTSLFDLYQFPTGRRVYAHLEVRDLAVKLGLSHIAEHTSRALEHDQKTMEMERARRHKKRNSYGDNAPELDHQLDRAVSSLDGYLGIQLATFPTTNPRHQAAARLRTALFPQGLKAVTGTTYVQQHVTVELMLEDLENPELAADAALLPDLAPLTDRIRALNAEYGRSLKGYERVPSMDTIREARAGGHALLLETVALIIARFTGTTPATRAQRDRLLEPILRQEHEIARARRLRQRPPDIELDDDTPEHIAADATRPAQLMSMSSSSSSHSSSSGM